MRWSAFDARQRVGKALAGCLVPIVRPRAPVGFPHRHVEEVGEQPVVVRPGQQRQFEAAIRDVVRRAFPARVIQQDGR